MCSQVKMLRKEKERLEKQIEEAKDRGDYEAAASFCRQAAETYRDLAEKDDTIADLENKRLEKAQQRRQDAEIFEQAARKETESSVSRDGGDEDAPPADESDVDEEQIDRWVDDSPAITFDDVGGMEDLKTEVEQDVIKPLARPELFDHYGMDGIGGMYLHGESGTGKSYFAKALAGELSERFDGQDEWDFISVSPADLMSEMVGKPARKLREVFMVARAVEPAIVFFDECDGVFPDRDQRGITGNERQLVNEALTQTIETNESDASVLVIGATNHLDMIDDAMKSSHRFQRTIEVPIPDAESRKAVLEKHLRDPPTNLSQQDLEWFQRESQGISAADVAEFAKTATREAISEAMDSDRRPPVTRRHLESAANFDPSS